MANTAPLTHEQYVTLHPYQQTTLDFMLRTPKCAAYLEMGLGKTLVTLCKILDANPTEPVLLIAPVAIARTTWINEINKWKLPIPYRSLIINERGKKLTRKKRYEAYDSVMNLPPAIYAINRELVVDLVNYFYEERNVWPFGTIIIDESQSFKSYSAKRFKALDKVAPYTQSIIELTGTPRPKDVSDLWSQIHLLDNGTRLGSCITHFRRNFMSQYTIYNGGGTSTYLYRPLPGAEDEIYRRIADITVSMRTEVLPPDAQPPTPIYHTEKVVMDDAACRVYRKFREHMALTLCNGKQSLPTITAANAAVLRSQLCQLASGTLYLPKDRQTDIDTETVGSNTVGNNTVADSMDAMLHQAIEQASKSVINTAQVVEPDGERAYAAIHDAKLEHLDYLANSYDSPILVAYRFRSERDAICRYLADQGHDVRVFDGSQAMQDEWNNGDIPVMLLQPASHAHGLNIQYGGHVLVWFTLPDSLEQYQQTNARLVRQGQRQQVIIHHLVASGTVDAKIIDALNAKARGQDALMDATKLDPMPSDIKTLLLDD